MTRSTLTILIVVMMTVGFSFFAMQNAWHAKYESIHFGTDVIKTYERNYQEILGFDQTHGHYSAMYYYGEWYLLDHKSDSTKALVGVFSDVAPNLYEELSLAGTFDNTDPWWIGKVDSILPYVGLSVNELCDVRDEYTGKWPIQGRINRSYDSHVSQSFDGGKTWYILSDVDGRPVPGKLDTLSRMNFKTFGNPYQETVEFRLEAYQDSIANLRWWDSWGIGIGWTFIMLMLVLWGNRRRLLRKREELLAQTVDPNKIEEINTDIRAIKTGYLTFLGVIVGATLLIGYGAFAGPKYDHWKHWNTGWNADLLERMDNDTYWEFRVQVYDPDSYADLPDSLLELRDWFWSEYDSVRAPMMPGWVEDGVVYCELGDGLHSWNVEGLSFGCHYMQGGKIDRQEAKIYDTTHTVRDTSFMPDHFIPEFWYRTNYSPSSLGKILPYELEPNKYLVFARTWSNFWYVEKEIVERTQNIAGQSATIFSAEYPVLKPLTRTEFLDLYHSHERFTHADDTVAIFADPTVFDASVIDYVDSVSTQLGFMW